MKRFSKKIVLILENYEDLHGISPKLQTILKITDFQGSRNLLRAQIFCYETILKITDFVTNYEFWEHWPQPSDSPLLYGDSSGVAGVGDLAQLL